MSKETFALVKIIYDIQSLCPYCNNMVKVKNKILSREDIYNRRYTSNKREYCDVCGEWFIISEIKYTK